MLWFKKPCDHRYNYLGQWKCEYKYDTEDGVDKIHKCPISFFECQKCGHRTVAHDEDYMYTKRVLQEVQLWLNGQIDINFVEDTKPKPLENDKVLRINSIIKDMQSLEMSDIVRDYIDKIYSVINN